MRFTSLGLPPDLLKGIEDAGFEKCTTVQEQSLPETLAGKDIIAQSQTGTGKTAVFLITIFNKFLANGSVGAEKDGNPRALILVPTRELAVQVERDAEKLGKHLPFRYVAVYGGVDYDRQIKPLKQGVDIVVATPGRLIDLYKSKNLSLDSIELFVIDEADRMFDMGFAPDVRFIADRLPKEKHRQTLLFSATIDYNVMRLSSRYMKEDSVTVEIEPEQITVDKIDQKVVYCSNEEKVSMLLALLNKPGVERVIIFTNMKRTAEMVGWKLAENSYPAEVLTGDVSQSKRQRIIDGMKSGKVKMIVATDVAARGLHIEGITHVVNYDLPDDSASYVHRIGRTARAGESGEAWSLVCESHAMNLPEIEKYIDRKLESEWIDESEIPEDKAGPYRRRRRGTGATHGSREARGAGGTKSAKGERKRKGFGSGDRKDSGRGPGKGRPGREKRPAGPKNEEKVEASAGEGEKTIQSYEPSRPERPTGKGRGRRRPGRRGAKRFGGGGNQGERKGQADVRNPGESEKRKDPSGAKSSGGRKQGYRKKFGEDFRADKLAEKIEEQVERKIERMTDRAKEKIYVGAGKNPTPPTPAAKEKAEGVLKKVLKVFWKKS